LFVMLVTLSDAQIAGVLSASQSGRECALEFIVLEMPRDMVTGSHPLLGSQTACALKDKSPAATLLRNTVLGLARAAPGLSPSQRVSALAGVMGMLGVVDQAHGVSVDRRILQALAHIDSHLTDRTLSAATLAATLGISRQRLDDLFATALGRSAAAQIWQRRFTHAASLLRDPRRPQQLISEIAHASGFEDTGHFVRAFKRGFGQSPGKWRSGASPPQ
jgi:AraC-like DNA-binding protein